MLGQNVSFYKENKSIHTVSEILQQPNTWLKTYNLIKVRTDEIKTFLTKIDKDTKILLCGAGSSEFVGNTIINYLNNILENDVKSIPTTSLVANPKNYINDKDHFLVISYGRSGSSPESIATINLINQLCTNINHIFITCNKDGLMIKNSSLDDNCFYLILPEETHDISFAMTSSFSNMLLATMLFFDIDNIDNNLEYLMSCYYAANKIFTDDYKVIDVLLNKNDFNKIVYLGNSALYGIAQESALKMLELTAGNVYTMFNTPLGFRHGPKSIIKEDVLVVSFISEDTYASKYELDLIKELQLDGECGEILLISNNNLDQISSRYQINFGLINFGNEIYLALLSVIIGQILALKSSLKLGISSDNPSPLGMVNRVVKGVTIYEYEE